MFRYIILGLLRNGETLHGYGLMKEYQARSGLHVSSGNFYRELQRLASEGLISAVTYQDGDPRRTPYEITEAGAAVFDQWLLEKTDSLDSRHDDELSTRVLFLAAAREDRIAGVLEAWRRELWVHSKLLDRSRQSAVKKARREPRGFAALPYLLARRLKHVAADLEFLEEFAAGYKEWTYDTGFQHGATVTLRSPRRREPTAERMKAERKKAR